MRNLILTVIAVFIGVSAQAQDAVPAAGPVPEETSVQPVPADPFHRTVEQEAAEVTETNPFAHETYEARETG